MRAILLVAILFLAGCTQSSPAEKTEAPTTLPAISDWSFDDCFGFATYQDFPFTENRGVSPPSWTFDPISDARILTKAVLAFATCNRASILGLERGPVSMLVETHTNFASPDSCEIGKFQSMEVLSKIWFDDADIVALLQGIGLPAATMELAVQTENGTPLNERWTFVVGGATSELNVVAPTYESNTGYPWTLRLVSWHNNRLSLLDFNYEAGETPIVDANIAFGNLAPGFLMSGGPADTFVAQADVYIKQGASTVVSQFSDSLCMGPLEGP